MAKNNADPILARLSAQEQQALKDRFYSEFLHPLSIENRVRYLQDQMPQLWSRIVLLDFLGRLQQERGGQFEKGVAFIYTATSQGGEAFNVRKIGQLDYFGLVVPVEIHEHDENESGIAVLPLDTVVWVGVTDQPFDKGEMGFGTRVGGRRQVALDVRRLAGLEEEPQGNAEGGQGEGGAEQLGEGGAAGPGGSKETGEPDPAGSGNEAVSPPPEPQAEGSGQAAGSAQPPDSAPGGGNGQAAATGQKPGPGQPSGTGKRPASRQAGSSQHGSAAQ